MRSVKLSISLQQLSSVIYVSSGCTLTAAISTERERRGAHGEEEDLTWAGGGEHGQGMGVVVPPAVPLNELLLTLQDAESCCQSGVKYIVDSCRPESGIHISYILVLNRNQERM